MHEPTPPTLHEDGHESHPAWALIGVSRVSSSPPGATLFDSDIQHQHSMVMTISRAERRRDLKRDWFHGREKLIEVQMSEAQWASFISSPNAGQGVPATLRRFGKDWNVPGVPYEPRLRASLDEARNAAQEAFQEIQDAFAAYDEHRTAKNRRNLEATIKNAPANVSFAAKSLSEHAENVGQRMRADIESMVIAKAEQLQIPPEDLLDVKLLEEGN